MQIRELFTFDIGREITTVIKMDQPDEAQIAQELREYVVTPRIGDCLLAFFERFAETRDPARRPTDKVGVWIDGFFGSGKSHMAKVIGHLLKNQNIEGNPSLDIFLPRMAGMPGEMSLRGALTQVRNFFDNHVITLQIKSEQDLINPDSISEILYRRYLESRGLSRDPWIGRLELGLIAQGVYDAFQAQIQKSEGQPWSDVRDNYLIVRSSIVDALRTVLPGRYPSRTDADQALEDIRAGLRMGPTELARELADYVLERQRQAGERSTHLIYIVDEVSMFIGDNDQKLLELQSIAEEFGTHGKGRLWLVVTAQEKIEDVIEGVKRKREDFSKILGRFDTRLELTSENIERVVEERILKKRPQGETLLQGLHQQYEGTITLIGRLDDSNRTLPTPDAERFAHDYPFLPMHFTLMQDAFARLRAKGGPALQLTGSERSMIGVVQAILKSPQTNFAQSDPGRLVALHEIYDQIESEVSSYDRRSIAEVGQHVSCAAYPTGQALKGLFVLQQVGWVPCSLDNLARLLLPDVKVDYQSFRENLKQALAALRDARYITVVDSIYKYLSVAERNIEDEIAAEKVTNNDVRREARRMMRDVLSGVGRLNYDSGLALFEIRLNGDDEPIRSVGEITLEVYSPVGMILGGHAVDMIRDVISPTEEHIVYWLPAPVTDPIPDFKRLISLNAVIGRHKGQEQSSEEVVILREKEREANLLGERLKTLINRALYNGQYIYNGQAMLLDGKVTSLNTIFNRELAQVIPQVFTKFHIGRIRVVEASIDRMLTTPTNQLQTVDPNLWDDQGHIQTHLPVVAEVVDELKRRRDYGQPADGDSLANHFGSIPYGWNPALLRIVLAALWRAGVIGVRHGGTYYPDPGVSQSREALTRSNAFNKALFEYDPDEGVPLQERKKAQHDLDILFDRKVDDTVNTLHRVIQEELKNLKSGNKDLRLRVEGGKLPVKNILYQGDSLLDPILSQQRPSQTVRAFQEQRDSIQDLMTYHHKLAAFIEQGRLSLYTRAIALLVAVDKAAPLVPQLNAEQPQQRVTDIHSLVEQREVIEKWNSHFQPAYQQLLTVYQHTYADLYSQRTQAYRAARDQIAAYGSVPEAITRLIVEQPGGWSEDGLAYAQDQTALTDLVYQLRDVEQRKTEAIEAMLKQQPGEEDVEKTGGKVADHPARPRLVKVRDYLPAQVSPDQAQDFQSKVKKLAQTVEEALKEGRDVIIR